MKPFAHFSANSVTTAVHLLSKYGGRARLNAGGTDLLGLMKDQSRPDYPEALINIKTIPGLNTIEETENEIVIGAMTTLVDIIRSETIARLVPALKQAAVTVASPQIRNLATIGGNLCQDTRCWYYRYPNEIGGRIFCNRNGGSTCPAVLGENRYHAIIGARNCFAVCPSDTAVPLVALGAILSVVGKTGKRFVTVEEFFTPLGNVMACDEIVTSIHIPKPHSASKQTFLKFTLRKPIDFAVVSSAALITLENGVCSDARIVVGAVAYSPLRAKNAEEFLRGKHVTEVIAAKAAELAMAGTKPLSQNSYKVDIAKTLVKRVVTGDEGYQVQNVPSEAEDGSRSGCLHR